MSEKPSSRAIPESLLPENVKGKTDSQLRLVRPEDGPIVFPENADSSDEAATIISKTKPLLGGSTVGQGVLAGHNLRGQRLAHFELLDPIGVGGMAAVIRARDTQLDRFVALKILPPDMAQDIENIRRFHQEARAAARLDHENIARVFYCGEDKNLNFIAFEFVEGENLRVLLEKRGRLPVAESVRSILQIAAGLEHAATRGVVHRDIKPSNIIISPNGRAKLVDMGLARSLLPQGDQALTQSGVTLGTFDYISPEQALEPREADVRSDIYSLGCTFYHMLTGQAPVPEGTAAKKLHHHQHVAPIDPRQLNPDIPDEVAAILMRMMAKDPKDRYQRPVQLIQHLVQVAEKVGAGADVPEGVMFLDAPLPSAPRLRPMLTVSLAALGLSLVLLVLAQAPTQKNTGNLPTTFPHPKADPPSTPLVENPPAPKPSPGQAGSHSVKNHEQLAQILENKERGSDTIFLESEIPLGKGLTFQGEMGGPPLVFKSRIAEDPAILSFNYQPRDDSPSSVAGLNLEGGDVRFENIRFEMQLTGGTPTIPVAMVAAGADSKVTFVSCTFVQKNAPFRAFISLRKDRVPLTSVLLDNSRANPRHKPVVTFEKCFWEQGQAAVTMHGPGRVAANNCAFGPHGVLFHLRGNGNPQKTELALSHCSAFVVQGPAFRLDDRAGCTLRVSKSIFSCPDTSSGDSNRDEIQFIRQTDAQEPLVKFEGDRNCYHNLNALWVWPSDTGVANIQADLAEFKQMVVAQNGRDNDSFLLAASPWANPNPLQILKNPQQAFQVSKDLREVRTRDLTKALGVDACAWGAMDLLPPWTDAKNLAEIKTRPNEKIIDPDAPDNTPGIYQTLAKALPFTRPGDVLLLKHGKKSRDIEIKGLNLDDPLCDLTIKPYPEPGNQPFLVFADKITQKDAALFRLFDGKVHFENLEFLLEPDQPDFKAQAIVALAGNGFCSFKNCVVTLRNPERGVPLSVVTFVDADDVMKTPNPPARTLPQVHLTDSFVRGEGDFLNIRSSRPFELKMENSLLALAGSLLVVQGGNRDALMDMPAHVKLSRVTALLTEPYLNLKGGKTARSLTLTRCDPVRDCLFVGLAEKPFLYLEDVEAGEDTLRQFLDWKGEKNAFVNLERLLELHPPESAFLPVLTRAADAWRQTEPDAKFLRARFDLPPLSLRALSQMSLSHFKAKPEFREELAPYGATLDPETLPRLTAPRKLEAANSGD